MSEMMLPDGWKSLTLDTVATEFISGGTPSTKNSNFWDGSIPWTTSAQISDNDISLVQGQRFITQAGLQNSSTHLIPKGNLLVGTRVGVGKAVENQIDVAISQDLTGVVLESTVTNPDFIAYQFKTRRVQLYFDGRKRGTTIKGISRFDLKSLELLVPPLSEQQAIAHALRTVQQARETRQRELALEQERKAALMEYLFTHGIYDEPRQQTDIGELPQSWSLVELGECIADGPQNGIYKPAKLYGEGTPIIRIDTFDNSGLFTTFDFKRVKLSSDEVDRYLVSEGDILINRVNSLSHLGKSVLISKLSEKTVFESNMMRLHVDEAKLLPEFLIRYLVTPENKDRMRGKARRAVAQSSINQGDVKSLLVPVPPLSEQQEIANVLQACDTKIAALERESDLLNELFRAILEELMTGKIRMKDE